MPPIKQILIIAAVAVVAMAVLYRTPLIRYVDGTRKIAGVV